MKLTYEEIRDDLKTGDIVLFGGKGFVSWLIKKFTKNQYSHVGVVLKIDELDFVAIWESTTLSDVPDIFGQKKKGVQIVQMSQRLANYKGQVAVRQLFDYDFTEEDYAILNKLRHEINDRPYEKNYFGLIKSAWDGKWGKNKKRDLSSIFCSELVAELYLRLGLIARNEVSSEYTPADFSEDGGLKLLKGVLGPEIIIK